MNVPVNRRKRNVKDLLNIACMSCSVLFLEEDKEQSLHTPESLDLQLMHGLLLDKTTRARATTKLPRHMTDKDFNSVNKGNLIVDEVAVKYQMDWLGTERMRKLEEMLMPTTYSFA